MANYVYIHIYIYKSTRRTWLYRYGLIGRAGLKAKWYGQHFFATCRPILLLCNLQSFVARITTPASNLSPNKFQCCKLQQHVARSRTRFYFWQHVAATCNTEMQYYTLNPHLSDVFATCRKIYWYYGAVLNRIESGSLVQRNVFSFNTIKSSLSLCWINCKVSKATWTKVKKNEIAKFLTKCTKEILFRTAVLYWKCIVFEFIAFFNDKEINLLVSV